MVAAVMSMSMAMVEIVTVKLVMVMVAIGNEDADYGVALCATEFARMMTLIMMDTLKSELRLAQMKAAEISGCVVGCSERSVRQWYADICSSKDVAMEGHGTWQKNKYFEFKKLVGRQRP